MMRNAYEEEDPTPPPTLDCAGVLGGSAYMADCGCIGGTTGITVCPPDPCAQKADVKSRASNSIISGQNSQILSNSTTNEYGTEQNLQTLTGSTYINTTVRNDNNTGTFHPIFKWNSTDGYTVGSSHGHPAGMAPSPADVIWMYQNMANSELIASGNMQFYKDNVSITAVTTNATYVVTVRDWTALQTVFQSSGTLNADYLDYASDYLNTHSTATNIEASEYALMTLFGGAINFYKAPSNSTNFEPLEINSSNAVSNKPC
jgi:hypothetical protein